MEDGGGARDGDAGGEAVVAAPGAGAGAGAGAGTGNGGNGGGGGSGSGSRSGAKLPQALQRSFGEVQGILEHNRVLIQEISQNQETRDPDGLTRNVALIRELNTNISRVVGLYADLSGSFNRAVAAKKAATAAAAANASANAADKGSPKRPRSAERK
ncbi:hypothetical protein ACP70R_006785 [Stipagrostis hirtigluma subsp. patula]